MSEDADLYTCENCGADTDGEILCEDCQLEEDEQENDGAGCEFCGCYTDRSPNEDGLILCADCQRERDEDE